METQANEYFIEKIRLPVALQLTGGAALQGELFVQASARNVSALEDAPEFMNTREPFFPLRTDDGRTLLIAKGHVLSVRVAREHAASVEWTLGDRVPVQVVMQDGDALTGDVQVEQYVGHARLLDHLNRSHDPFVALLSDHDITLINRRHIAYIRPIDDAAA